MAKAQRPELAAVVRLLSFNCALVLRDCVRCYHRAVWSVNQGRTEMTIGYPSFRRGTTLLLRPSKLVVCSFASLLLSVLSTWASATLITFNTRAGFDAAAPGLPVETFESGLVGATTVTACAGPLSNAAGSACFPTGSLLAGVTYNSSSGPMVVLGAGFPGIGNASKVLGPDLFADTFNVLFANADATGFDVFPGFFNGTVLISIFDVANALLGSFTIAAETGGTFFGVLSTSDDIGRINIASQATVPGELIDNLAFGTPQATVPVPASLALLGFGLAGLGFSRRRK
jgi:PEP-CTERM motif